MAGDTYRRDALERRKGAMKSEQSSFISHWKELAEFIRPRRGRFFTQDRNRGDKRFSSIINSKATQAHRTASAGLLAGTMSPARPWFALQTLDPDMMEREPVQVWCWKVAALIRDILNAGNFYNMAPTLLSELLLFGTGAMTHVEDFDDVARFYTHTIGSYMIGQDDKLKVNTLVREFDWTVGQIVSAFGGKDSESMKKFSPFVQNAYAQGNYDQWTQVTHFIDPNPGTNASRKLAKYKPFRSCYYEPGNADRDMFLSESGFDQFPAYCPRWDVTGEDIYGTDCPAMTALGDIKGLQIEEKRKAQAIDKMVNPPLKGPASLKNVPISSLPGGINIYDMDNGKEGLSTVYQVNPNLGELRLDINAVERRIDNAFYVDLWLAISTMEGIQPKNQYELMQRNEERLLQLGPVLERLHGELLGGVIGRVFAQCVAAKILPPAPPEMAGKPLKVNYISSLALAQRAVATGSIDRMFAFAGGLAKSGFPQVIDKLDADQAIDEYAKATGVSPRIIVPDDQVAMVRKQRAAEAQQQQQMAQMQPAAQSLAAVGQTVKALSDPNARAMMTGATGG